jgi:hypothetical protein
MKIYVNGDSHAAAAEAVNPHAFAEDDQRYFYMGRAPHPDNLKVSWAKRLSETTKSVLHLDAESASSNTRILRTTRAWLEKNQRWWPETLVIIQWSTWERTEWLIDGVYYQINASGVDIVPDGHQDAYREFIAGVDLERSVRESHDQIWSFHQELLERSIAHIFFNGNSYFGGITDQKDWGASYIKPYDPEHTYNAWLKNNGHDTVAPDSWHFGADAHAAWARFMLQYIIKNNLMV